MTFEEAKVHRDTGGRFTEWKGTNPDIRLDDAASVQSALDTDESLPSGFRYVAVGMPGALTVFVCAPHDMDRGDYIDLERSRVGRLTYQPHVRAAITRLHEIPGVKWVNVMRDELLTDIQLTPQGRPYQRSGRHVVDIKLTGPAGSFTAPVPSTRSQEAVKWLAQTGQYPVLEKVVGSDEARRLIQKHRSDEAPPSGGAPDTLF